jgi:hypothetical protein
MGEMPPERVVSAARKGCAKLPGKAVEVSRKGCGSGLERLWKHHGRVVEAARKGG